MAARGLIAFDNRAGIGRSPAALLLHYGVKG